MAFKKEPFKLWFKPKQINLILTWHLHWDLKIPQENDLCRFLFHVSFGDPEVNFDSIDPCSGHLLPLGCD